MRNAGLDEAQAGIKIARRNIITSDIFNSELGEHQMLSNCIHDGNDGGALSSSLLVEEIKSRKCQAEHCHPMPSSRGTSQPSLPYWRKPRKMNPGKIRF